MTRQQHILDYQFITLVTNHIYDEFIVFISKDSSLFRHIRIRVIKLPHTFCSFKSFSLAFRMFNAQIDNHETTEKMQVHWSYSIG